MLYLTAAVLLIFSSCSRAEPSSDKKTRRFICDVLDQAAGVLDTKRPHDGKFHWFDRVFSYQKTERGHEADWPFMKGSSVSAPSSDKNLISKAHLTQIGEQEGQHREVFEIYRFLLKEKVLIHSYVYYVSPEDYKKRFSGPAFAPHNKPLLFDLIAREPPEGFVKIGWDKSRWQCYDISFWRHWLLSVLGPLSP